jgi:hypothetical protein
MNFLLNTENKNQFNKMHKKKTTGMTLYGRIHNYTSNDKK